MTPEGVLTTFAPPHEGGLLLFYGGPFSNWVGKPMRIDGSLYHTPEHYFMRQKAMLFGDRAIADAIDDVGDNPAEQKKLGRLVLGFDAGVWRSVCRDVMRTALVHKFRDETFRRHLLATGDATLVEASPTDVVWGIGLDAGFEARHRKNWRGTNWLGECLMDVRASL